MKHYKNEFGKVKLTVQQFCSLINNDIWLYVKENNKKSCQVLYHGSINSIPSDLLYKYIDHVDAGNIKQMSLTLYIKDYVHYMNVCRREKKHE